MSDHQLHHQIHQIVGDFGVCLLPQVVLEERVMPLTEQLDHAQSLLDELPFQPRLRLVCNRDHIFLALLYRPNLFLEHAVDLPKERLAIWIALEQLQDRHLDAPIASVQ
jgi:hypothetical protein